jgi:ATP-dependent Clp protease ATP-binding subunit ClpA
LRRDWRAAFSHARTCRPRPFGRRSWTGRSTPKRITTGAKITFSVETIRVLQFAAEEADRLRHNHIGTEHLLLGVLSEPDSVAATMLTARGITSNGVRDALAQLADTSPDSSSTAG